MGLFAKAVNRRIARDGIVVRDKAHYDELYEKYRDEYFLENYGKTFLERIGVAKIKSKNNSCRYVKEFGGAIRRKAVSQVAKYLVEQELIKGRVLDYGCGFGFDADHYQWEGYDPYTRQKQPEGKFDTIVCNHVANILTRKSRQELFAKIVDLLTPDGNAYISVSRNIPVEGKLGIRKRIQNYVVLTLPSVYADKELEIYRLQNGVSFTDKTQEIEHRL